MDFVEVRVGVRVRVRACSSMPRIKGDIVPIGLGLFKMMNEVEEISRESR